MAGAYVGGVAATATSTTLTLTRTTAGGNCLAVLLQAAAPVTSITDSAGNVWRPLNSSGVQAATGTNLCEIWYCPNASSITSLTVTVSSSGVINGSLIEMSGLDLTNPVRASGNWYRPSAATAFGGDGASSTIQNTVVAGDFILEVGGYVATTSGVRLETVATSFTAGPQTNSGTTTQAVQYRAGASGSVAIQWTLSTAKANGAAYALFKAAQPAQTVAMGDAYEDLPSDGMSGTSWAPRPAHGPQGWNQGSTGPASTGMPAPSRGQLWPPGISR